MPTVVSSVVTGLAFCPDPRCPGYEQVDAAVRVDDVRWTYVENGGDLPGIEKSNLHETFALEEGEEWPHCPHCGKRMEATTQERPVYAMVSGQDPLRLLNLDVAAQTRKFAEGQTESRVEIAELKVELANMRAEMMSMLLAARGDAAPPAPVPVETAREGGAAGNDEAGPHIAAPPASRSSASQKGRKPQ